MADSSNEDLSAAQQDALQQYIAVTNQEPKDAIPLLQRSQWNVQVRHLLSNTANLEYFTLRTQNPRWV